MKKLFTFALFGFVAVALTLVPDMAHATATPGSDLLGDISGLLSGNVGTLIGLGIAIMGLYMWLVQQASWGIVMIIGGVAITAFPGIFLGIKNGFNSIFDSSIEGAAPTAQTSLGTNP